MLKIMKKILNYIAGWFSNWQKIALEISLIVILFVGLRYYQQLDIHKGAVIPISGTLINGSELNWAQYKGKPMLIHFWATWCAVCRLEEQSIQSIAKDYNVLTISSWSDNTQAYLKKQGLDFPTLVDSEGQWAALYGLSAVPASFIVNADGYIEFIEIGFTSEIGLRLRLWWLAV